MACLRVVGALSGFSLDAPAPRGLSADEKRLILDALLPLELRMHASLCGCKVWRMYVVYGAPVSYGTVGFR